VNITVKLDLNEFRYDKREFDFRVVSFGERLRDYRCKKLMQFHGIPFKNENYGITSEGKSFPAGSPFVGIDGTSGVDNANVGCVYDDVLPNMYDPDGPTGVIAGMSGDGVAYGTRGSEYPGLTTLRDGDEVIDMSLEEEDDLENLFFMDGTSGSCHPGPRRTESIASSSISGASSLSQAYLKTLGSSNFSTDTQHLSLFQATIADATQMAQLSASASQSTGPCATLGHNHTNCTDTSGRLLGESDAPTARLGIDTEGNVVDVTDNNRIVVKFDERSDDGEQSFDSAYAVLKAELDSRHAHDSSRPRRELGEVGGNEIIGNRAHERVLMKSDTDAPRQRAHQRHGALTIGLSAYEEEYYNYNYNYNNDYESSSSYGYDSAVRRELRLTPVVESADDNFNSVGEAQGFELTPTSKRYLNTSVAE
jgi:hypothetical protein